MQFLDRVTSLDSKLCIDMLNFDHLSDLEEELEETVDVMEDMNPSPEIPIGKDGDDKICIMCFDREIDGVLIPCGHVCICKQCFDEWDKQDPRAFNNDWYNAGDFGEPLQPTSCPLCRIEVTQHITLQYK